MTQVIFRQDREGWAYGKTETGELFVGNINDFAGKNTWFMKDTTDNRAFAERHWKVNSFSRELKTESYHDFVIQGRANGYAILNLNGQELRVCRTKKECKERIDNQTV